VPGCALAIEEVFHDAGFPDGAFQTLLIPSDRVDTVLSDPASKRDADREQLGGTSGRLDGRREPQRRPSSNSG